MERCSATATICADGDNRGRGLNCVAPFARCSKAKRALLDLEGMVPGHITYEAQPLRKRAEHVPRTRPLAGACGVGCSAKLGRPVMR
jgi:hypothetical protein